jgi:hypothetical protein
MAWLRGKDAQILGAKNAEVTSPPAVRAPRPDDGPGATLAGSVTEETTMARCETCGNDYDKSFQLVMDGRTHTFDSFECAIHKLAPACAHCGCRVIGHGSEHAGAIYCCAHCAKMAGVTGLDDRN